jgi:hypothetical protein
MTSKPQAVVSKWTFMHMDILYILHMTALTDFAEMLLVRMSYPI